jgi:hypothetical protein
MEDLENPKSMTPHDRRRLWASTSKSNRDSRNKQHGTAELRLLHRYMYCAYNPIAYMHNPLKPADFHILLTLADGPRHGYGIMKDVESESGGDVRLEIGSLYRLLARMLEAGLRTARRRWRKW